MYAYFMPDESSRANGRDDGSAYGRFVRFRNSDCSILDGKYLFLLDDMDIYWVAAKVVDNLR